MTSSLKSPHNSCLAASCKLCAMDSMYKKHSQSDFEKKKKKKKDSQIPDIISKIMAKSVKVIYEGFDM